MKFDASKFLPFAFKVAMAVPQAVQVIESAVGAFKHSVSGPEKEDAAVNVAMTSLGIVESMADKDVLNDPAVESAIRSAMQAIVNVQNVVASVKAAKAKE